MVEASSTYTKPMQEGGPMAKGIIEDVVRWREEKSLFSISCQDLFWEVLY